MAAHEGEPVNTVGQARPLLHRPVRDQPLQRHGDYAPSSGLTGLPRSFFAADSPQTMARIRGTSDLDPLRAILAAGHFDEVVLVEMRNQPGALAQVMERLAEERISIDYAYCAAGEQNGKSTGVFKVSNPEKCMKILGESPATRAKRDGHGGRGWGRTGRTRESTTGSE